MNKIDIIKSIIIMIILDATYITFASKIFKQQIFDVQKSDLTLRWFPTIICYIALVFGLNYFILSTNKTRNEKILNAVLLGLVIYSVYEMTTFAMIKDWHIQTVIIDTLWGGMLFGLTTFLVTLEFK